MSHSSIGYIRVLKRTSDSFKYVSYLFQTINVTTAATGYGLGLACATLVSQVWKTLFPMKFH